MSPGLVGQVRGYVAHNAQSKNEKKNSRVDIICIIEIESNSTVKIQKKQREYNQVQPMACCRFTLVLAKIGDREYGRKSFFLRVC